MKGCAYNQKIFKITLICLIMDKLLIEEIRVKHLGKEYEISGEVVKIGRINTKIFASNFECTDCGSVIKNPQENKSNALLMCSSCGNKKKFFKLEDETIDEQVITITDTPKKTFATFPIKVYVRSSELIDKLKSLKKKDRINIIGDVGAEPKNKNVRNFVIFAKDIFRVS